MLMISLGYKNMNGVDLFAMEINLQCCLMAPMHEEMKLESHDSRSEHRDSKRRRRGAWVSRREQREK